MMKQIIASHKINVVFFIKIFLQIIDTKNLKYLYISCFRKKNMAYIMYIYCKKSIQNNVNFLERYFDMNIDNMEHIIYIIYIHRAYDVIKISYNKE